MPKQKSLKEQGVTKSMLNKLLTLSNSKKSCVVMVNVKKPKR